MLINVLLVPVMLYPILEAFRDALMFPVKPEVSKNWHLEGFAIRAILAVTIFLSLDIVFWIIPYSLYFSLVFDMIYNVAVRRDPFHIGTTSFWDKKLGKWGFVIKAILLGVTSAILTLCQICF